jgi:hypothetical protein
MKLSISKTEVTSSSRKTNTLIYESAIHFCQSSVNHTGSFKDLNVFLDSKLYLHKDVKYLFSLCIKLLGLVSSITLSCSSLEYLYILYFTLRFDTSLLFRISLLLTISTPWSASSRSFQPSSFLSLDPLLILML